MPRPSEATFRRFGSAARFAFPSWRLNGCWPMRSPARTMPHEPPDPNAPSGVTRLAMSKVEQIISDIQAWTEKVFKHIGSIEMMFHFVRPDGRMLLIPAPPAPDKDTGMQIVRSFFAQEDVVAYVCITESWVLESE